VNRLGPERPEKGRAKTSPAYAPLTYVTFLFLVLYALPIPGYGHTVRQEQPKEPLGSLSGVGEVYVNEAPAPADATIFAGDRVRTGETGTAIFTIGGKGTLKISPQSQVLFSGNYQFTAELEAGTVILNSIYGPSGVVLRIGNFVVVSSSRQLSATSRIDRAKDGSFIVSCLDGGVGVLTLEAKSGEFLQAGQSLTISAGSELLPSSPSAKAPSNVHPGWILLGLAGAGAAGAAAALTHGGGRQSISPSTP
jgi:hypothetical protein